MHYYHYQTVTAAAAAAALTPHQTKLNSHKNLCKAVNLDQIGFDLSANEISAPDRSFVIDSVLDRGDP